ncbi:DUF2333 family protein [Litchfieldella xinjiangensis]|uniref:DUF2333 family protein n=1 Tax=Litchfieldella xinjiangensis TaxID=1166948 RepID=UPI0009DE2A9E|nr:DUF2333 family protein [Halomonas xinjiangensis]
MALFGKRKAGDPKRNTDVLERPDYGWIWKPLLALLVLYLLVTIILGIWWSQPPSTFDVEQATAAQRGDAAEATTQAATTTASRGAVTTATLMTTVGTLLEKPGGYLRNDKMPPGVWLDNMPNWEYGVLRQARDLTQSLPALSEGDEAAFAEAHERLSANSKDWLYPSAERRYEQALEALEGYLRSLSGEQGAGFATNGDGVSRWLSRVEQRLDSLTHRLSASVAEREALRDLIDIETGEAPSQTPWYKIDNVFFEARGTGWALIHLLEAVEHDLADVIDAAGATSNWQQLIAELKLTQRRVWSPVILNGSGFGLFANHSLVMANYTARARELAHQLVRQLDGVQVENVDTTTQPATQPVDEAESGEAPENQGGDGQDGQDKESGEPEQRSANGMESEENNPEDSEGQAG